MIKINVDGELCDKVKREAGEEVGIMFERIRGAIDDNWEHPRSIEAFLLGICATIKMNFITVGKDADKATKILNTVICLAVNKLIDHYELED